MVLPYCPRYAVDAKTTGHDFFLKSSVLTSPLSPWAEWGDGSLEEGILETENKVVGLKQTLRVLQQNKATRVFVASDIDDQVLRKIKAACLGKNVKLIVVRANQKELGRMCRIDVGAAVVALVRN